MNIVVCMKQVPVKDSLLKLKDDGSWIHETDLNYEINESDHYALEEALRLKEKHGGEVVLLSMGPERVKEAIKQGLAKGADRAIHIDDTSFQSLDPDVNAKILAAAIKKEQFDLVLTGLQSDDYGFAQTGVILAEFLGVPHGTIVMEIQAQNGGIKVKRELEAGWFQWVELPLPALLTIQSGINQIRYATIKGIMMAKKKEIKALGLSDLGLSEDDVKQTESGLKFHKIYIPEKTKQAEILEGKPKDVAKELVDKLKNEAKVF
ncbi:electron transfer flavoprotein subunit beta/FixA family protein [candidate division KSB1 bacterium]|nr:electron transfer flavoprotein subunit beta/FixA family protein [candidate division KSB1 bacterium]NIR70266.1 electron transfer flavoprotein subunit beta/FixA family protein [candidate division KSB1 bacterium]NIS26537.1 electron transfer flavoprotein subunit beta/FixA family protein [candidate division KSB1 bacterium]NIT73299.1 electron transfer flavoprotein subunit beta/FixA family protein [candidate division KSB1 bacterium]NIU23923.1 electron transfer flavoprotein subunit beta/FixA family 